MSQATEGSRRAAEVLRWTPNAFLLQNLIHILEAVYSVQSYDCKFSPKYVLSRQNSAYVGLGKVLDIHTFICFFYGHMALVIQDPHPDLPPAVLWSRELQIHSQKLNRLLQHCSLNNIAVMLLSWLNSRCSTDSNDDWSAVSSICDFSLWLNGQLCAQEVIGCHRWLMTLELRNLKICVLSFANIERAIS